ncbi:PA14 domain-containing protein [Plebeiibacterium sediminum]|uniref:Metallophosphoesterase n=1 Tax=Plebeiibacterium sediminum TaxID=2992112 RepID=A0AAE3SER6_9BACT|nr:PA14 domain-containing protein [Plebeiobacterium sediminum]MCW3786287.1 metallophosphoesterase [Plebeiobacterium sediminum]
MLRIKKLFKIAGLLSIALITQGTFAQNGKPEVLYFNNDQTFKVLQFTDVHWAAKEPGCKATLTMMNEVLDKEKPDLVVYTGDVVLSEFENRDELASGWKEVTAPVRDRKINWVAVLGNHDSEGNVARNSVYDCFTNLPYNINGTTNHTFADFSLPVSTTNGATGAVLYFFDSNDYAGMFQPGKYGWITKDQVEAYQKQSENYTKQNNGTPVPSLAFFHIPIPEYKELYSSKDQLTGHVGEEVSSPDINSGLFAAMALNGDVMGVFCGHDHNNDFIGEWHDIALAYGRCSGNNAYGDYRNGARVITLTPHQFSFDSWISIPSRKEFRYHFPKNTPVITDYLPAQSQNINYVQGINYTYYKGEVSSVNEIESLKEVKSGNANNFDLSLADQEDHYAFVFEGFIDIPAKDVYTFYLRSDDGSQLFIDDVLVVDNDGGHSARTRKGHAGLDSGKHKIKLLYFEDYMGQELKVGIQSQLLKKDFIKPQMLFRKK